MIFIQIKLGSYRVSQLNRFHAPFIFAASRSIKACAGNPVTSSHLKRIKMTVLFLLNFFTCAFGASNLFTLSVRDISETTSDHF